MNIDNIQIIIFVILMIVSIGAIFYYQKKI